MMIMLAKESVFLKPFSGATEDIKKLCTTLFVTNAINI